MKVFVQHAESGLYLKDLKRWVKDEEKGRCFNGSLEAIDFCIEQKLGEVIVVLKFGDPRYDIQLRPFVSRHQKEQERVLGGASAAEIETLKR